MLWILILRFEGTRRKKNECVPFQKIQFFTNIQYLFKKRDNNVHQVKVYLGTKV